MSERAVPVPTDPEILSKREANRTVVEQYLAIKGNSVEERMALFHDEILYEIVHTEELRPERTCGRKKVQRRFEDNAKCWRDFAYSKIKLRGTEDPECFIAECDGDGAIVNPMFTSPRPYHNYYYIIFTLREGKIWQLRQFTNPIKLMHDFWCEMPDFCK